MRAAVEAVRPDEVLDRARALIGAPSENPGQTEHAAADVAADILASLDVPLEVVEGDAGRPSIVASLGEGDRGLAWNGHLDVVPAGDPASWRHAPFGGVVEGQRLYGRGAADMKGPIACALGAVAAIRRAGIDLGGRLTLHLVADEENEGKHGTRVLLDRGMLVQDACIVGEPTEMRLGLAERGGAWFTVRTHGRAAHGSTPDLGVNAITTMARVVLRLGEVLPELEHPLVGRPTVNVSQVEGGRAPNVVPDLCSIDVDRRTIPGEDRDSVEAGFARLAERLRAEHPEAEIESAIREWTEAAEAPADSRIAEVVRRCAGDELEHVPSDMGFTGITDARFYLNQAQIPTVIFGPGDLRVAHTADEYIPVGELGTAARIYAAAFVRFLGA